jgi:hypothetical protein
MIWNKGKKIGLSAFGLTIVGILFLAYDRIHSLQWEIKTLKQERNHYPLKH